VKKAKHNQGKYIPTIDEKPGYKGMSTEVCMEPGNTGSFGKSSEYKLYTVIRKRFT
jgi:hypothetical protein